MTRQLGSVYNMHVTSKLAPTNKAPATRSGLIPWALTGWGSAQSQGHRQAMPCCRSILFAQLEVTWHSAPSKANSVALSIRTIPQSPKVDPKPSVFSLRLTWHSARQKPSEESCCLVLGVEIVAYTSGGPGTKDCCSGAQK